MRVEEYDGWIVRVGSVYLVAIPYEDTKICRMSNSPYDAARIEDRAAAERIAKITGGKAVMFNPVTGKVS